jgi:transcriptional regulator with XRE-family HTH domain
VLQDPVDTSTLNWGHYTFLTLFFMTKEFALDLKVARQNSGLTQEDCARLLGVCDATVAKMEGGTRTPTVREICTLSLIYGRSFESLFSGIFKEVREDLFQRLMKMPAASGTLRLRSNRQYTLGKLATRLSEEPKDV